MVIQPNVRGARLVVKAIEDYGIKVVFGVTATHVLEIFHELSKSKKIYTVFGRSDFNVSYMAEGYSRKTNTPGVCIVTGGPGIAQSIAALTTSWSDSSRLVIITSDVNSNASVNRMGYPHENYDTYNLAKSTGAFVSLVSNSNDVYKQVIKCFKNTEFGRPNPSVCVLTRDSLTSSSNKIIKKYKCIKKIPPVNNQNKYTNLYNRINKATRPIIIVGGGAVTSNSENLIRKFFDKICVNYVSTALGKSAINSKNKYFQGVLPNPESLYEVSKSDLVIALGTSFGRISTNDGKLLINGDLIQVDIDSRELNRVYKASNSFNDDLHNFLDSFNNFIRKKNKIVKKNSNYKPGYNKWVKVINNVFGERERINIVLDVTIPQSIFINNFHTNLFRKIYLPWNSQNLGYSYPASLGIKIASQNEKVICIIGDGGILYSLGELLTAKMHKINVCVIVFNNKSLGTIEKQQSNWIRNKNFGTKIDNTNFHEIANHFNFTNFNINSAKQLDSILRDKSMFKKPSLIQIDTRL